MKFSKPRILLENNYPDLDISQPALLKRLVDEIIYPPENSSISDYIDTTIVYLKNKLKDKAKKVNINAIGLGESLFFAKLCLTDNNNTHNAVRALIDTGAANSLLHESVVQKYKIPYEPVSLRLCTANGFDDNAIIGKCHLKFIFHDSNNNQMTRCTNFIISKKLNNLECILGAEFLFSDDKTITLDKNNLAIAEKEVSFVTKIFSDDTFPLNCKTSYTKCINLTCGSCENNPVYIKNNVIYVKNLVLASCGNLEKNIEHMAPEWADFASSELCEIIIPPIPSDNTIPTIPPIPSENIIPTIPPIPSDNTIPSIPSNTNMDVMSHSIKDVYKNETLPYTEEFFDENHEIKFEALEKRFTIEDGDF